MQETTNQARAKVVNISEWRVKKAQGELPLFARAVETDADASLVAPAPERALLPREVAHREQMLRFLRSIS